DDDGPRAVTVQQEVAAALAAVLPEHERQVREQAAAEIEALRDGTHGKGKPYNKAFMHALDCAIRHITGGHDMSDTPEPLTDCGRMLDAAHDAVDAQQDAEYWRLRAERAEEERDGWAFLLRKTEDELHEARQRAERAETETARLRDAVTLLEADVRRCGQQLAEQMRDAQQQHDRAELAEAVLAKLRAHLDTAAAESDARLHQIRNVTEIRPPLDLDQTASIVWTTKGEPQWP
ncbi:MAG: hypothetical protein IRZ07_29385, partial [Microbispora sp.]|nr:hypothetical protein [Microbispora sp.]